MASNVVLDIEMQHGKAFRRVGFEYGTVLHWIGKALLDFKKEI